MKSRSFSERRVEITREREREARLASRPIRSIDFASDGLFSRRSPIDFVIKAWAFASCKFTPIVAQCPMTMQDPINMYKRERHDTSSSVNANLYVSKVEDTGTVRHYRCTIVDWKANNDKYSIDRLQLIKKKTFLFFFEIVEKIVRIWSDELLFRILYIMRFAFD